MLLFDIVPMKDSIAAPKDLWLKTPYANLVRHVPSGVYFSRIRVRGKLIRRSLKPNKLPVAKLRLADLEKVVRQRVEVQRAIAGGNMRWPSSQPARNLTLPVSPTMTGGIFLRHFVSNPVLICPR